MNYSEELLNVGGPERDMIKSQIQEDFAKADIYFQSLNVQTIVQEKKYTVSRGEMYTNWFTNQLFCHSDWDILCWNRWLLEPLPGYRYNNGLWDPGACLRSHNEGLQGPVNLNDVLIEGQTQIMEV